MHARTDGISPGHTRLQPRRALDLTPTGASTPNMTPMVDVVMVILVFFMATAAITAREWLLETAVLDAPAETSLARSVGDAEFVFRILPTQSGVVIRGIDAADIPVHLAAEAIAMWRNALGPGVARTRVVIEPADGVAWADVIAVREGVLRAGVERVAIR